MKKTNKILSVFMALIMMLSIVSITAVAEEPLYSVGDIIEFGSYPQSEVKDDILLAELNAQTLEWISYGYYSGTIDEQVPGDFMKYADVTYNNNKYRAVTFTDYRPLATAYGTSEDYSCQPACGYETGIVYWFIYEPIQWCILDPNEGFVLSETIIDSQAYQNTVFRNNRVWYQDSSCEKLACDYAASSIREWLNDDFYNTAFTDEEKAEIFSSVQENTLLSDSVYDGEATNDKIFLLSYDDVTNEEYGFVSHKREDVSRQAKGTDYAKCQGVAEIPTDMYFPWWLRTGEEYGCSGFIAEEGECYSDDSAPCWTCIGVRPAMKMNLNQDFDVKKIGERFSIMTPSRNEIRYKDGIILHAEVEGNAPVDSYIRWYVYDYEMFTTHVLDNGYAFELVSENKGKTWIEARLYDEDGNCIASDTIMMHSDAGLFQKFIGIFRVLFNKTTIYEY